MKIINKVLKKYNDIPLAAKAAIWFVFCSSLQKGISLITTPIFTRMMTTEQYGQFSVYNSWLQIFTIITTLRLNYAVFNKGMSKYKEDRDGYVSTMQSLTFIITAIVFIIYLIFRKQINELTELPTFIMVAMFAELFVMPAIDFWTIRKRYEYIYKPVVIRTTVMAILNAGIGILAVFFSEEKGYARILTCILVNFFFGMGIFIYNILKGKKLLDIKYVKFALAFNLPLLFHYLSQYALDQFDRIMIQKLIGIAAAGIYSVAYNAAALMKIITQNINNALIPWQYGKLEKDELEEMDNVLYAVYVLVAVCVLLFSAFAPEIMTILADEKYYEAVYVIPPVALGLFFSFMYTTFANIEFFYENNKFTTYISLIGAGINIITNYIGIKAFGYIAAAYTTLLCYMIFSIGHYIYMTYSVKKILKVDKVLNTKRIVSLWMLVLFCGLAIIFLYDKMITRYVLIAVIFVIGLAKKKQIQSILKLVKNKK